MTVRVYLPVSAADLADLVSAGRLAGPREGHGVTAALREAWPDGDDDGHEYAALMAAASESASEGRRRVLAVDVDAVEETGDGTLVRVTSDVTLRQVASAHLDVDDWSGDEDDDLAWFATQEIGSLLG